MNLNPIFLRKENKCFNKVEGKLRHVGNPHSEERMKLILSQLLHSSSEKLDEEECEDEISHIYYDDRCSCGKNAKCKSSKCICFIRGVKCQPSCHASSQTKCANK